MDVTYFPYDTQKCDIELVSWGFHNDTVNLTFYKSEINLQDYRTNGEWELESTFQETSEIVEDGLTYSELVFKIELKRLSGYYVMSIIFPVILIAALSAVAFLLPVESGEKLGYIITVILALAVLLMLFAGSMPTTSKHTSVLVVLLIVTLGLATIVIMMTVLIIRLYYKEEDYIAPMWIYKVAHKFKHFSCKRKRVSDKTNIDAGSSAAEAGKKEEHPAQKMPSIEQLKKKYPNKVLAEIYDDVFEVVFLVLYILVVSCFTITLAAA